MTIAFNCSACDAPLKLADDLAGKKCKCPKCGAITDVPEAGPAKKDTARIAAGSKKKPDTDEGGAFDDLGDGGGKKAKGKRAAAKKGGGMKWLLIGGGALLFGGGFLTCACGGGFFVWWYFFSTPDDFKYLPSNTQHVHSLRVDQAINSSAYKEITAALGKADDEFGNMDAKFGLADTNVERVVTGSSRGANAEETQVVRTKSSVEPTAILSTLRQKHPGTEFTETKQGKYTIYERKGGGGPAGFVQVASRMIVYGNPKTLRSVLDRDKAPDFSPAMQAAMKRADFSNSMTTVRDLSDGKEPAAGGGFGFDLFSGGGSKSMQVESRVEEVHLSSNIVGRKTTTYTDYASASSAKKEWDEKYEKAKQEPLSKEIMGDATFKAWVSGNSLVVENKFPASTIKKLIKLRR
jgi:hypothetical protein